MIIQKGSYDFENEATITQVLSYQFVNDALSVKGNLDYLLETDLRDALLKYPIWAMEDEKKQDSLADLGYDVCETWFAFPRYFDYTFQDSFLKVYLSNHTLADQVSRFCLKGNYVIYQFTPEDISFRVIERGWD